MKFDAAKSSSSAVRFSNVRADSNHIAKRVYKQIFPLAAIQAKLHLRKVHREMFCADLMPASNDAALEPRIQHIQTVRNPSIR